MNILEKLWFGNLCPIEEYTQGDTEYAEALRQVVQEQDSLSPAIQKEIEKLTNAKMELSLIGERDAFIAGFRLGMQLMAAGLEK